MIALTKQPLRPLTSNLTLIDSTLHAEKPEYEFAFRDRPDDWRIWPPEDQGSRRMKTGLGSIYPTLTNGILVLGTLSDGRQFVAHITNVPPAEKTKASRPRKAASTPRKPRSAKSPLIVEDSDLI